MEKGAKMTAKIEENAPDFSIPSTKNLEMLNEDISLSDYKGKWLILFFYPFDFTFVCPTEILAFNEQYEDFKQEGAEILGISTDSHYCHNAWMKRPLEEGGIGDLKFPLGADIKKEVSKSYGVLCDDKGVAFRGVFIINPHGIVKYSVIHNMDVGRNVDEILRVLKALKTEKLCPANWQPGDKTLD